MGLKKIILRGKEVPLTTKTERKLFKLVCKERKQNVELVRFICQLNKDIKTQQDLLECLAEHLKKYQMGERTDTKDSSPSGKDSTDEKGSPSDPETGSGEQEKIKKRKLSSTEQSDQDENTSHQ